MLLTAVRSSLHKKISFYYQMSPQKAGKGTGVENNKFIHFNLTAGIYSIDDFKAKINGQSYRKDNTGNHLKLKT